MTDQNVADAATCKDFNVSLGGIMREDIEKYLDKKYGSKPEYLWRRYPGYHMNKNSWITIALDGTAPFEKVCNMIDASFEIRVKHSDLFRKRGNGWKLITLLILQKRLEIYF